MNNSAAKVGDIFREAGTAFTKLSEMTLMLQDTDDAPPGSKWSEEEVEMLRGCVNRFAVELNKISRHIKTRTMRHLKHLLEMNTGPIYDINRSPPRQQLLMPQPLQPTQDLVFEWEQQPQIITPQHENTLEAEAHLEILFPKDTNNKKDDVADLLHFNPGIVPLTPPANIMEEDSISQQSPSEFDSKDNTRSIDTIYAELLHNQEAIRFDPEKRRIITKKGQFMWSPPTKTWVCVTNSTANNIGSEKRPSSLQNFFYNDPIGSVQVPAETANRPQLNTDPVPGAYASYINHINDPFKSQYESPFSSFISKNCPNDDPFKFVKITSKYKPEIKAHVATNVIFDPFSSLTSKSCPNDDPFKFVKRTSKYNEPEIKAYGATNVIFDPFNSLISKNCPNDDSSKLKTSSKYNEPEEEAHVATDVIPGPLSSLISKYCPNNDNNYPIFEKNYPDVKYIDNPYKRALGAQAPYETTGYFSSIRAEPKEQVFPSSAHFNLGTGSRGRGSSRRRGRGGSATQASIDLSSPTVACGGSQDRTGKTHQIIHS